MFVQRGGLAGLAQAETFVPGLVERLRVCRDTLLPRLAALPGVSVAVPAGGMYAFFRVEGQDDSLAFAKRLVTEAGLGLAPGAAFGDESEGWLRWCFASRDPSRLEQGVRAAGRGASSIIDRLCACEGAESSTARVRFTCDRKSTAAGKPSARARLHLRKQPCRMPA